MVSLIICRLLNAQLGETSRIAWLGVEVDPLAQSENLVKVYNRPSEAVEQSSSSNWYISEDSIISGFGFPGNKQEQTDAVPDGDVPPPPPPKTRRRKKTVRRKVATARA